MTEDEIKICCLIEIDNMLGVLGKSLRDFDRMPVVTQDYIFNSTNTLIFNELSYNKSEMKLEHDYLFSKLNDEQFSVYEIVIRSVSSENSGVFFVYGYGGTGKMFLWKTLSARSRSEGRIMINVASSGIASLLLPGGRIAHSRFTNPINCVEDSTCNIGDEVPASTMSLHPSWPPYVRMNIIKWLL
ncbi:hypothetical protein ACS0TY_004620 [Phlomoides rotata]